MSFILDNLTKEELNLINSLNKPINDIDMDLVKQIINKILLNHKYEELLLFLNQLYDFAKVPDNITDILITSNNKECISVFLENEDGLYFLTSEEINKLKTFLNVHEVNIKLEESYDFYYKLLYNQDIRTWSNDTIKINDDIIEHRFTKYNKSLKFKLKEIKDIGVVVECTIYSNYDLSEKEQILKCIDYINEFGFNIKRDINNNILNLQENMN